MDRRTTHYDKRDLTQSTRFLQFDGCDEFIENVLRRLPDPCRTKDLIRLKIYASEQAASIARKKGLGPCYFKPKKRQIYYPRAGVIEYLQKSRYQGEKL